MLPMMVRSQIDAALSAPDARDAFASRMTALADRQGAELDEEDLNDLADMAERYVRSTLRFLESCATAANQAKVERMFEPMIGAATRIILETASGGRGAGLFGMLCDSYAIRAMFSMASERARMYRGFPLFSTDPHPEAEIVRAMIGVHIADSLDELAEDALEMPQIRVALANAFALPGSLRASGRVDDWELGWEEEVVRFGRAVGMDFAA